MRCFKVYHSKLKSKEPDTLFEGGTVPQKRRRVLYVFEDLCTVAELSAISQRYKVAQMLKRRNYLPCDRRKDRRVHGDNFACEPLPQLWHGGYGAVLERNGKRENN